MTELELRGKIATWLMRIIPSLWVGKGNERPEGKIALGWNMEHNGRPATPFLDCKLSGDDRVGYDVSGSISGDLNVTFEGDRETTLYLTSMGKNSGDVLKSIRNSIYDASRRPFYHIDSFIVFNTSSILDTNKYVDSMPESRSIMDLSIRFLDTWTTDDGSSGVIETVNMNGDLIESPIPNY